MSKLTRRTWGPAKFTAELMEHLEGWRSYYHLVPPHESLETEMAHPVSRKEKQLPKKYRHRTPAMLAGLTNRRWGLRNFFSILYREFE